MSKEQSLADEIEKTLTYHTHEGSVDLQDSGAFIHNNVVDDTNHILKAIDSRLPKEKSRTVISSEIPDFSGSFRGGYNKALSDVRKELGL